MPASSREASRQPLTLGAPLRSAISERANDVLRAHGMERLIDGPAVPDHVPEDERSTAILFVGGTTEPSPVAGLLASETGFPRIAVAEERLFLQQESGSRINGDGGHRDARDSRPRARSPRQARSRVKELATANRRKDEFLAIVSHELRSPLAAIKNAVGLLNRLKGQTPARQQAQALIERQVRGMTQLVDDLIDVSRIRHGRMHLRCERIDLRVVLSDAVATLAANINERNQRLTSAMPDAPVWLLADPWRLEQVFVNLLANASRYTDAGGTLAVRMHSQDGQAVVGIRDSGMGIAAHALPHVFDLFRQADEAASHPNSGLGIGLALVRNLVQLHGGSVTAASGGIGQGSEFTVRLPSEALEKACRSADS